MICDFKAYLFPLNFANPFFSLLQPSSAPFKFGSTTNEPAAKPAFNFTGSTASSTPQAATFNFTANPAATSLSGGDVSISLPTQLTTHLDLTHLHSIPIKPRDDRCEQSSM